MIAVDLILLIDICTKMNLVTNGCIQDSWAPCVHGGKLFTKIFTGGTVEGGMGGSKPLRRSIKKEIIFNRALCSI